MKRQINLLSDELMLQRQRTGFTLLLSSWGLTLLAVIVAALALQWQLDAQRQYNQRLVSRQTQLQQQQEALAKALAQRRVSSSLQQQLVDLKLEWQIKQQLIGQVSLGAEQAKSPYSMLLRDLASVDEPQIWLDGIEVVQDQVALSGFAADAQLIPGWLSQLGERDYLQGRSFARLAISESNRWHKFELKTREPGKEAGQ